MERLVEVVQRRARERAQRFVGRTLDVLVEGPSRTTRRRVRGRTPTTRSSTSTASPRRGRSCRSRSPRHQPVPRGRGVAARPRRRLRPGRAAAALPPRGGRHGGRVLLRLVARPRRERLLRPRVVSPRRREPLLALPDGARAYAVQAGVDRHRDHRLAVRPSEPLCEHMFVRWASQTVEQDAQGRLPGYRGGRRPPLRRTRGTRHPLPRGPRQVRAEQGAGPSEGPVLLDGEPVSGLLSIRASTARRRTRRS